MPKIAEVKLLSCELEVADLKLWTSELTVIAEQHFVKKLRNCDCGRASSKLQNCDGRLKKTLRVPTWPVCHPFCNMQSDKIILQVMEGVNGEVDKLDIGPG